MDNQSQVRLPKINMPTAPMANTVSGRELLARAGIQIVAVDSAEIRAAEKQIESCEQCNPENAEVPELQTRDSGEDTGRAHHRRWRDVQIAGLYADLVVPPHGIGPRKT